MAKLHHLSSTLIEELDHALELVKAYGSIEIYVQNSTVTQITVRNIKKTKVDINSTDNHPDGKPNGKLRKFAHR